MSGRNANIGRRRFIGSVSAGVGAAAVGLAGRSHAIGGDEPWENRPNLVWPSANVRENRENIQKAVDTYRTVRLMPHDRSGRINFFNLLDQRPIEITRDVTIVGANTIIGSNNSVFHCNSKVRLTIKNIHFSMKDENTPNPIDIEKPANHASVTLNLINVALGNDDPWD
jgi:hypothetical protein